MKKFYKIPLTREQEQDVTKKDVDNFFNALFLVPKPYLMDIVEGYNQQYHCPNKEAREILKQYTENRFKRNDAYFEAVNKMLERLYANKLIIAKD